MICQKVAKEALKVLKEHLGLDGLDILQSYEHLNIKNSNNHKDLKWGGRKNGTRLIKTFPTNANPNIYIHYIYIYIYIYLKIKKNDVIHVLERYRYFKNVVTIIFILFYFCPNIFKTLYT